MRFCATPVGRPTGLAAVLGLAACLLAAPADLPAQAPAAKRPLRHSDYEIWNTAAGVRLAPDGKHLVYTLTPGAGDGAVVIRDIPKGTEHRIPSGGRSAADPAEESPAAGGFAGGTGLPQFTPDAKKVVLHLPPPRSAVDKAKADKKKPEELPKTVLAVIDLATGKVTDRFEKARSFAVAGTGAGYLVYHKEPKPEDQPKAKGQPAEQLKAEPRPAGKPDDDQPPAGGRKGGRGMGSDTRPTPPRQTAGSDLVIRNLADGSETAIADVAEYSVTKDHRQIVYTVQSKAADRNGVFVAPLARAAAAAPVRTGPGRYFRLTWDEKQTKLAFFYAEPGQTPTPPADGKQSADDPDQRQPRRPGATPPGQTAPAPPPPTKVRVFVWERAGKPQVARSPMSAALSTVAYAAATAARVAPAAEVLGPDTPGLKKGYSVIDRGGLSFSADGLKLSVGVAQVPDKPADPAPTNPAGAVAGPAGRVAPAPRTDDRVDLDIWHWKDELIQPMQKVRRTADRDLRAVYFLDTKQFRQLGDEDTTVAVPGQGDWALASSDKKYRGMQWLSPTPRDYALVNVRTGESKPLLQHHEGSLTRSPKGRCLVLFDGKNWYARPCPDGKLVNLTGKLPVKFYHEDHDVPAIAPAHGLVGFTTDERYVLLADRYDIWQVAVDGSGAENLTKIGRELKTRFRPIRLDDEDAGDRGIDLSKPMLLSAENLETYDTGYYRLEPGQRPKMLLMGARRYGSPGTPFATGGGLTKAKNADVYLFTVQTFSDYPDYYVADKDFKEIKRVTDINPRVREFNWGKAELVHYHSADGVPLKGILIKPEDFDPAKKYPMIVYIYERLSQNLHSFRLPSAGTSISPTYYASNGYLVLMPDIAYTVGSPGQSALKCVLPAIQAVVDKGCVNEAAIGIQGHSWGGYQIAYMVTQTNRFKAAAAGAPVANMTSAYDGIRWGTGLPRQFQYEKTQSRIGKTLWEAPMRYIENSPVFMADRVQTPLLILHNDQDDAVPWYQGIEYYLALRRLGKECYLLDYNGEPHGLRRKATQRDYTLRMQQFFDHHLKGAPAPEWMVKGVPFAERDKEKEQWKKLFEPEKK